MQSEQAMVNPGGTGTPRFVISARFAPLPPRMARMSFVASARPSPKKYTERGAPCAAASDEAGDSSLAGVAMSLAKRSRCGGGASAAATQHPHPKRSLSGSVGGAVG